MFELIALGIAGGAGVMGHLKSRKWVRRRLRYTEWVQKPGLGLAAGVITTIAAAPLVGFLPLLGPGAAMALGAGVGTGVHLGAKEAREGKVESDF